MTVREIVVKYLRENGYEGLRAKDGACACVLGDIATDDLCCMPSCAPCHFVYQNRQRVTREEKPGEGEG